MSNTQQEVNSELTSQLQSLQEILNNVNAYIFTKDLQGRYTYVNPLLLELFDQPLDKVIGATDSQFFSLEESNDININDQLVMLEGRTIDLEECNVLAKTGETRYYRSEKKPLRDKSGKIIGMFGISTDITDQKTAQSKIEKLHVEQSIILNNQLMGIVTIRDREILWANSAIETLLGYDEGELSGASARKFYTCDEDYQAIGKAYDEIENDGGVVRNEVEFSHKNGDSIWVTLRGAPLHNHPADSMWIAIDISDLKQAEEKLKLSSRVFSETHEGITITDADMNIIDINPAFSHITGYSREDVIGKNPKILNSGKQSPEFYKEMSQQIVGEGHWQGEVWNRKKDGEIYAELLTISSLANEDGNVMNYVGVFSDITRSKQQQELLSLMAHYDVLTELPNRALFVDRFHQAIAHSKRTNRQLAICFIDLDNFKPVNDNYGHDVGDKLLIEVAERITACIREEDTVSRQGGDEFALILNDIESYEQCKATLEKIHALLAQPYIIDNYPQNVTASSGTTLYPGDDGDIDTLLRHADQAMYQAKLAGKSCYHLFNPEHDKRTIQKHHQLEEIERALSRDELELFYQPKVNMVTGSIFGVEALIRWAHPEKGIISPLDFLPVIEGTPLEFKVGNWVINEALAQLETWDQQGINPEVSVNISSRHLLSETFFADLDAVLTNHSMVDSRRLQLEIVESSVLGDLNKITKVIESCQYSFGVKVALDDFGTGYSSLTHLRSLPVNTIKIDQSFVRDMLDDPSDYAIIDGIIGLADSFGREVIAEGVETTNHGLILLMMGCEEAQGYGVAKPMPAGQYPQWLKDYIPNKAWLDCGNKHRTIKENKLKLFRLIVAHWKERFISRIQFSPEDEGIIHWPVMSNHSCPCGSWIQRAMKEQLFAREGLEQLYATHDSLHLRAQKLQRQYQNGDIEAAREGLTELESTFCKMNSVLDTC